MYLDNLGMILAAIYRNVSLVLLVIAHKLRGSLY